MRQLCCYWDLKDFKAFLNMYLAWAIFSFFLSHVTFHEHT